MAEATIQVKNKVGLHARPAALFVQTANKFQSKINVKNLTATGDLVDAKSIIMVLTLGVMKDHQVLIKTDGIDSYAALDALKSLIENNFGEA